MSFSNLRDHCAFAFTVLLSGKGMEPGRPRRLAFAGRMRSSEQSSGWDRMDRHGGAPRCHHHHVPMLVRAEGIPGCSPSIFAEKREHLLLLWHLLLLFWLHGCSLEAGRVPAGTGSHSAWPGLLLAVFRQGTVALMGAHLLCFGSEF